MTESFKVFCGWDKRQAEAAEVFRFSVEENASIDVDVRFLQLDKLPLDRRGVTDFTYSRFLVPFLCGYEGRALFADGCDMLCLGDVRELAEWDMRGKPVWVVKHTSDVLVPRFGRFRSWTSLMLMDCASDALLYWSPDWVARQDDKVLMLLRPILDDAIGALPLQWNTLVTDQVAHPELNVGMLHWSYLSDPNGGSWIDRSGSALWREWRENWRAGAGGSGVGHGRPKGAAAGMALGGGG